MSFFFFLFYYWKLSEFCLWAFLPITHKHGQLLYIQTSFIHDFCLNGNYKVTIYSDSRGYIISWSNCLEIRLEGQAKNNAMPACMLEERRFFFKMMTTWCKQCTTLWNASKRIKVLKNIQFGNLAFVLFPFLIYF